MAGILLISMNIDEIRVKVKNSDYRFTVHALERSIERNISMKEIESAVLSGEIIEAYPEDKYGPSCLIHGKTESGRMFHVVCTLEPVWIITAYDPALKPGKWNSDLRNRK